MGPRQTPWVKPAVLKGLNFYFMEWHRTSAELRTEIYSQFMVMLHWKTKHQNLGNSTSSRYNPAETAVFGYLHSSGGQHSPGLPRPLATGDTHRCCGWGNPPAAGQGTSQHAGAASEQSTITPRIQHLTCSSQEHPKTILLIHLPIPFPQSLHQFIIF